MHTSTSSVLFLTSLLVASTTAQDDTSTMQAVSQIADGQPQAPTASAVAPVSEIEGGQPEVPTASAVAPVSEIEGGQPEVPTASAVVPVSEIEGGQPEVPTASAIVPVSGIEDGQPQAPVTSNAAEATYSSYVNPYVTETNSLGVITGQPDVITSQATAATYYSDAPGIPEGLSTTLVPVVSSSAADAEETTAPANLTASTGLRTPSASRTGDSEDTDETATSTGFSAPEATTNAAAPLHLAGTGLSLGLAGAFFSLFF